MDATRQDRDRATGPTADLALLDQARTGVHAVDAQHGRKPDQLSENLAGSLAVAAKREGLSRIDHVVLSDDASKVYAVQGDMNSPHKRVVEIPTAQAVNTPLEQSKAAMEHMPTQQTQQQEPQEQQQRSVQPGHGP
ncbi:XVIPCD domain-containing protein [Luteibacter sp.]|uniref:XVIPCD domain-containing protein n=1 Tax=Luteibacter sp. TaxID=1886636 RepID=UPI0031B6A882